MSADRSAERRRIVLLGAAGLGGLLLLRLRDPHVGGSYGWCPFHRLTGLWCPLCGGLRATNDLTLLRVGDALSSNALAVCIVLLVGAYYLYWAVGRWRDWPIRRVVVGPRATVALAVVLVAFTVVRNLAVGGALAP